MAGFLNYFAKNKTQKELIENINKVRAESLGEGENELGDDFNYDEWANSLAHDEETIALHDRYLDGELLEKQEINAKIELPSLNDESYNTVLEKLDIYYFLKDDYQIIKLFKKTYNYCYEDFSGFDDENGIGKDIEEEEINENNFLLEMQIEKYLYNYIVSVSLKINTIEE